MNVYRQLLGLPESETRPDHYTLLGVPRFTATQKQVHDASVELTSRLRRWDNSKHYREANRLQDEIIAAAAILEDPDRKAAYDRELRRQLKEPPVADVKIAATAIAAAVAEQIPNPV